MVAFPSELDGFILREGFSEVPPNNTLRTSMAVGPAKVRRRATSGVRVFRIKLFLTTAKVAVFDSFYVSTVKYGSLKFDFRHPRTQVQAEYRFVEEPSYVPRDEGYIVAFSVELLP